MDIIVNRTFARRADDKAIGEVSLKGKAELTLDGKTLPAASVEYLANFGLQSLQDAYAGKESYEDAKAAWEAKRDALIAGTIGVRTGGVDPWLADARKAFRPVYIAALAKAGKDKAYKDADSEGRNKMLDAAIEKNRDKVSTMVDKLREERAKVVKAASDITL
jgi:hypothetical protein